MTQTGQRSTIALVDSGSDDDLIARPLAKAFGFRVEPMPIGKIEGLNGDPGPLWGVVETTIQITDTIGQKQSTKRRLFITDMPGIDMILGIPWLNEVNPQINWAKGEWRYSYNNLELIKPERIKRILKKRVAFALTLDEINAKSNESLEIPHAYTNYADAFSEKMADELPPTTGKTHAIDTGDNEPSYGPIYALSEKELKTLREYLDASLKKG